MRLEIDNIEIMRLLNTKTLYNYNINEIIHEKRHHFNKILILSR